jgi:pyruvate formate lyase activating enzyme
VAIETCLAVAPGALEALLDLPILCLVDLKHVDADRFRESTGRNLAQVTANMTMLAGADLELRVPLVPGFKADTR